MAREHASMAVSPDSLMQMLASLPAAVLPVAALPAAVASNAPTSNEVASAQAQCAAIPLSMAPSRPLFVFGSGLRIAREQTTKSEEAASCGQTGGLSFAPPPRAGAQQTT